MDFGVWTALFLQEPLVREADEGPRVWLDLHARRDDARFTGIVRPGVGYAWSPRVSGWAGYAWVPSIEPGAPPTSEHRIWQQLLVSAAAGRLSLGLRPRLEQRFSAGSGEVGLRSRWFARVQLDLSEPVAWVVADEVFVALNDSTFLPAGFDQNRLFVGPALRTPAARIEVGAVAQQLLRSGEWSLVGIAATNVFASF